MSDTSDRVFDVAFIGCGQGGGRIAEAFFAKGYQKVIAINTAPQDLSHLSIPDENKINISGHVAGAGKNPSVSHKLAEDRADEIIERMAELFGDCDRIMVCIGAGGGTGSGTCIPVVKMCSDYMSSLGHDDPSKKVGVICTVPTDGECRSTAVAQNATGVLNDIFRLGHEKKISPCLVIDNNKIRKVFPGLTMRAFWPTANTAVADVFDALNTLPSGDSPFSSFDPADYTSIVEAGGCLIMGMSQVEDCSTAEGFINAFHKNMKDTVISDEYGLLSSQAAACVLSCSTKVIDEDFGLMDRVDEALDSIASQLKSRYIHRGIYEHDGDGVIMYSMVGGLTYPIPVISRLKSFLR